MGERKDIYYNTENTNLLFQDNISTALTNLSIEESKPPVSDNSTFSFIDLFAGIGGMRIAYERAGGRCVYSNEWNKFSQKTYFANFGELPEDDITKVNESDIPDHDILVAGFPCQPFSIA